jgi:hypothetical protein
LLLSLSFNGLPNTVTDQAPQSHLIFGTGNFIDTHLQLLFFYLLEKNSGYIQKPRPCCSSLGSRCRFNRHYVNRPDFLSVELPLAVTTALQHWWLKLAFAVANFGKAIYFVALVFIVSKLPQTLLAMRWSCSITGL